VVAAPAITVEFIPTHPSGRPGERPEPIAVAGSAAARRGLRDPKWQYKLSILDMMRVK
jgi:hypothetical protein